MGQKVHPLGFRLGVSQQHISHWFIDNNHYSQLVVEDQFIRNFFYKKFPGIALINIKRDLNRIAIEILSANTRDLMMDGGKMTAKATLSSPSLEGKQKQAGVRGASSAIGKTPAENPGLSTQETTPKQSEALLPDGQSSLVQKQDKEQIELSQNGSQALSGQQKGERNRIREISSSGFKNTVHSGTSSADNLCDQLLKELTTYRNTRLKKTLKSKSAQADAQSPAIAQAELVGTTPTLLAQAPITMAKKIMEIELFWTKVENPNTSAACLAEFIVEQLEKRVPFRRVLKRSIQKAEEASVEGIKVQISGRLNGAEIARSERIHKGQVPLHTLRAKIEYDSRTAKTIYGLLGVKVWVFTGFADLTETKLLT